MATASISQSQTESDLSQYSLTLNANDSHHFKHLPFPYFVFSAPGESSQSRELSTTYKVTLQNAYSTNAYSTKCLLYKTLTLQNAYSTKCLHYKTSIHKTFTHSKTLHIHDHVPFPLLLQVLQHF